MGILIVINILVSKVIRVQSFSWSMCIICNLTRTRLTIVFDFIHRYFNVCITLHC